MQHYLPLATVLANARAQEATAHNLPYAAAFGRRLAQAFPSLYRHPEVRPTRHMLVASEQWTFTLSGVEFLVKWHRGQGGYWAFTAWDARAKLSERDSFAYYTPDVDVALCCFVSDALAIAQKAMVAA